MAETSRRPAFYATGRKGGWRDYWTLLHPPYTAWHLSYVVIGSSLAADPSVTTLVATLLAFFLAVGVAAHALDELNGRPLATRVSSQVLIGAVVVGLGGAVALGIVGVTREGLVLVPFIVAGALLVVAYNAELFGERLHNDFVFAAAWGGFPVLTAYVAQAKEVSLAAVAAALGATALSAAQRSLSTPARMLRRRTAGVEGSVVMADGTVRPLDEAFLLRPLELALKSLSWAVVLFAVALALARMA